jgi:hypothetical protein
VFDARDRLVPGVRATGDGGIEGEIDGQRFRWRHGGPSWIEDVEPITETTVTAEPTGADTEPVTTAGTSGVLLAFMRVMGDAVQAMKEVGLRPISVNVEASPPSVVHVHPQVHVAPAPPPPPAEIVVNVEQPRRARVVRVEEDELGNRVFREVEDEE